MEIETLETANKLKKTIQELNTSIEQTEDKLRILNGSGTVKCVTIGFYGGTSDMKCYISNQTIIRELEYNLKVEKGRLKEFKRQFGNL